MDKVIRGLTLRHPWAYAIRDLGKNVENRSWAAPKNMIGQYIAIHGGAVPKGANLEQAHYEWHDIANGLNSGTLTKHLALDVRNEIKFRLGRLKGKDTGISVGQVIIPGIVAVAKLESCLKLNDLDSSHELHQNPWAFGPWCWVLTDIVRLEQPIPCKGAQGLWELPPDVLEAVRGEWAMQNMPRIPN